MLLTESPPCEAFTLASGPHEVVAAFINDAPACPDCVEFGTICRRCRKVRYEAGVAQRLAAARRATLKRWLRVAYWVVGIVGLLALAQWQADRMCAPGHWDAEVLACSTELQR